MFFTTVDEEEGSHDNSDTGRISVLLIKFDLPSYDSKGVEYAFLSFVKFTLTPGTERQRQRNFD